MRFSQNKINKTRKETKETIEVNLPWVNFIRYCETLHYGEFQKLQIQDGIPISAETATKKIKFN